MTAVSAGLSWRSVYAPDKFLVKGTELSVALVPGTQSRFQVCEVRSYGADRQPDRVYYLRDANTVTDAEVAAGVRPKVVGRFTDEEAACLAALDAHEHNTILTPC